MLIADRFVFIHIPKTGGTWVRETLAQNAPPSWKLKVRYPGHHRWLDLPEAVRRSRSGIYFVRNPWDWHVSVYHFYLYHWKNRTGGYAPGVTMDEDARWWHDLLSTSADFAVALRRALGADRTQSAKLRSQCSGESSDEPRSALRFENLRHELLSALQRRQVEIPPELENAIRKSPPEMVSPHAPFRTYYTPELAELVEKHEPDVLMHGYSWEQK